MFTAMFMAAGDAVPDERKGVASGLASAGTSVGAAVGLTLLVHVATAGTGGVDGEELLSAQAHGISTRCCASRRESRQRRSLP